MASMNISQTYMYTKLNSESHEGNLFKELQQFRKENKLCDLQVKIGENIFDCHSNVLSASSKYFRKEIFKLSENRSVWKITIDITGICSKKTFELILDYIYTSNVLVPVELIESFLNESRYLEIDSLKPTREKAFSGDVFNIENVCGKAKIIIVGGEENGKESKKVEALDFKDKTFKGLPDLPPIVYPGCDVIDNKLYIVGGRANDGNGTNFVFCLDTVTKKWSIKASMKNERVFHGLVSIGTKIYAIGGRKYSGSNLKSVECYDSVENEWHSLSDLPEPLSDIAVCPSSNGSSIYCYGGLNHVRKQRIYHYNVFTDTWTDGGTLPTPRFGATAVCINGRVFIFGGNDGKNLSEVLEYFPDQKTVVQRKNMPNGRLRCQAGTENNTVYILGGDSINVAVDAYDVEKNEWHKLCDIDCQRYRYAAAILKL